MVLGLIVSALVIGVIVTVFALRQGRVPFTRRETQALCLAATLIVMSSLVPHFAPEKADDLLIVGGLLAPVLVAAVAGRRFRRYGVFTVAAGILFRILADSAFQLSAWSDTAGLMNRYAFTTVLLGLLSLCSCTYLDHYVKDKEKQKTCSK